MKSISKSVNLQVNLVYSAQSLRDLEKIWIADVQANLKDALLILVGNKKDVDDEVRTRS